MANMSNAVGRMLNWAVAHPAIAGAAIGGVIGGVTTGSAEGAVGGAVIGGGIGLGIGAHQKNVINNARIQNIEKIEKYTQNGQKPIDRIKADYEKGIISKKEAEARIKKWENGYQKLVDKADAEMDQVIENTPMGRARKNITDRQEKMKRAAARADIREAKKTPEAPKSTLDTSLPQKDAPTPKRKKISYGIEKRKPNPGERTAGRPEKDFIQYFRQEGGGEKIYITSKQYGAARGDAIKQNPVLKNNQTGFFSVFEDAADEAAGVAEDISKTEVLDKSGIVDWMKEHPVGTAGIAIGGGFLLSNMLDDD